MSATSTTLADTGTSRETVALSGISDVLTWRHILESNPEIKRPGQRTVICPDFPTKLELVLAAANPGMDSQQELWLEYQAILNLMDTWHDTDHLVGKRPRLGQWEETKGKFQF
jgi:hypothetical protein